ncbi:DUF499 domain-containing protein [Actinomyces sp. 565]|uniref:DUF499 domain-containing protein n=1 Tax=Actinomyces sp. 565 TaxID=2057794 RepID=UPI0013A6F4FA|nr:DUF499 domain-containing protein [Actinomyces sp. 565]NDR52645.1 DUF499 domain-containing protein [Actinomyces sp. 565]
MALSNREYVGRAFELLAEGLIDTVDPVMAQVFGTADWPTAWAARDAAKHGRPARTISKDDPMVLLRAINEHGYEFRNALSRAQQSFASELRETRNQWAHGEKFSSEDTLRALDTTERLLRAVDAVDSAADVHKMHATLQRTVYEAQTRQQVKRVTKTTVSGNGLRPWREVIRPHPDVASGKFTASEFAADLHQVATGQAVGSEYADPVEFFSRTYLTEGLRDLLTRAVRRLGGDAGASPVINLQTNFGGGKTHSMLALYHLFGDTSAQKLPQDLQDLLADAGNPDPAGLKVHRVALVGTYLQAGSPQVKDDGTQVRTLWGELAWQLGGREAYDIIADADRTGTNPGDSLATLLRRYTPALILIDEWVAYARQLLTDKELPAGAFDTQFTFAQSLTEVVRSIPGTMLVVSIPASDSGPDGRGSDIEIGGENGHLALQRLQNVIRRVADQWRPSSRDESFEIVRRRLFQEPDAEGHQAIRTTARAFVNVYRSAPALFPREASGPDDDYDKRIRASYPLHPELLDRLYEDWSTLERFQRTRGVLKLVSSVVHELWASQDASPLILPGNVPLSATTVNTDLTQYLEDRWKPVIDSDIDGPASTAQAIDNERTSLGSRFITRRVARTVFLGAAPRTGSAHKGIDKPYVWLGTAVPGDVLGNFGSAVEALAQRSTYFYQDQGHYWFDTSPSLTKTANDYAERLREDEELVWNEIVRRLAGQDRARGVFDRVHLAPASSAEIPDLEETRLVVVHPRHARSKQDGPDSPSHRWVHEAIEARGAAQRTHRNALVFLLADAAELASLEAATRSYLGWRQVQANTESLNLSAQQNQQVSEELTRLNQTVEDRLRGTYQWALYPYQPVATAPFEVEVTRIPDSGSGSLAERVGLKLRREEQLVTELGASFLGVMLHSELKEVWERDGELSVGELWGYLTRYPYLPRLVRRSVLDDCIRRCVDAVLVGDERFAVASGKDAENGRYRGLIIPPQADARIEVTDSTLLVDAAKAQLQLDADRAAVASSATTRPDSKPTSTESGQSRADRGDTSDSRHRIGGGKAGGSSGTGEPDTETGPTRFFGYVTVDPERYGRDIGTVTREVIDRLAGTGAQLKITIDIEATKPGGFHESDVRTISENARTLKFDSQGFEAE